MPVNRDGEPGNGAKIPFGARVGYPLYEAGLTEWGKYSPNPGDPPTLAGYTFKGWYKDPDLIEEYNKLFDFGITMPNGPLVAYAKWESNEHTVKFYDDSTTDIFLKSVGKGNNEYVREGESPYTVGQVVVGKGTFTGWFFYPEGLNILFRFSYDTPIIKDRELHASWQLGGYTVIYDIKGGTGSAPTHNVKYNISSETRVEGTSGFNPPTHMVFIGWVEKNTGRFFYPGMICTMYGDAIFEAVYGDPADYVKIIYHSNYPDGST